MKNVVIAGGGEVGFSLARTLSEEGHNITIIEKEEQVSEKLESLDILVVTGNAASPTVLDKAYIESADFFIAVTGSDEVNMASCAIAHNKGSRTLARINGEDYLRDPVSKEALKDAGIDIAFCPDMISSTHMANILNVPFLLDTPMFDEKLMRVMEHRVDKGSRALGSEIRKLKLPRDINLVAVFRNEEVLIPKGSLRLEANDRVLSVVPAVTLDIAYGGMQELFGSAPRRDLRSPITKIMVAGGSRIGYHIARLLSQKERSVILIEEDGRRCKEISERLDDVLVINGSPTDKELLKLEGVSETDAFLAVTEREEVNILTSLLAGQFGAKRSIALVDRPDLKSILEEMGIDLIVSPRSVTLSAILRYFHEDDFPSMAVMGEGELKVVEVKVKERSKGANKRVDGLMTIIKRDLIIGAIVRDGKVIIPRGETYIRPKDRLMVFTKGGNLKWLKDHF